MGFVAPLAAALGGGAAAGGGIAALTAALPAVSAVASGLGARAEAKAVEEQNKVNAYIGRTRAAQTDTSARESLNSELGTLRATFAANGQRATVGTEAVFNELRRVRGRDRRIEFGNRMQEASSYNMAAKSARQTGNLGLIGGVIKAAPSVFDVYQMKKKGF
jgi:hypothetical protein